jgi:hypothetical protein
MRVKGRHTWFSQQKCAGDLADFQRKDVFVLQLSSESCSLFKRQGSIESIVTHEPSNITIEPHGKTDVWIRHLTKVQQRLATKGITNGESCAWDRIAQH